MYIPCKEKQGRQTKIFEIRSLWDHSMAQSLRESRSDETYIKKLQISAFEALMIRITTYQNVPQS